ncbi:hypothetical protein B0T17DRAFT_617274 [Bombardia bombarda]|uniref:CorA-like transporter domain-containing protein n=1 Tax=Bombardia bombarda TaxID=252184 RepID=A0AA39X0Q3_9PEZI|nr:hypothetical protein B0T17DRAFT_617274 [Bombardia bombarda]
MSSATTIQPAATSSDGARRLRSSMRKWKTYPNNIPRGAESAKLIEDFKQHFHNTKEKVLITQLAGRNRLRNRRILRMIHLVIQQEKKPTNAIVETPEKLWEILGIDFSNESTESDPGDVRMGASDPDYDESDDKTVPASELEQAHLMLRKDPVCRFIFLEMSSTVGRFKITEEMLLKILTYHQVSPYLLNYLGYFAHNPMTRDSDLMFGGFKSLKRFSKRTSFDVPELGRSGTYYELVLEFRTIFDPKVQGDDDESRIDEQFDSDDDSLRSEPGGLWGRIRRIYGFQSVDNTEPRNILPSGYMKFKTWPVARTVVYHRFDVLNWKSLWIMTSAEDKTDHKYRDIKKAASAANFSPDLSFGESLKSSLGVMLWLAEWSLSDYASYIAALDDNLQKLTEPFVSFVDADLLTGEDLPQDTTLKMISSYMESLDGCIVGLQANMRVLTALPQFYKTEFNSEGESVILNRILLVLLEQGQETFGHDVYKRITKFEKKLKDIYDTTNYTLQRAQLVKRMGKQREEMMQRLVQNKNEKSMTKLADLTRKDAVTMKAFAAITLVLLPMSVVSTIFSTDIVKFQNYDDFIGSWSRPAVVWWLGATIITTLLVSIMSKFWLEHEKKNSEGDHRRRRHIQSREPSDSGPSHWNLHWFRPSPWAVHDKIWGPHRKEKPTQTDDAFLMGVPKVLLDHGARINERATLLVDGEQKPGPSVLEMVVKEHDNPHDLVKFLLDSGADIELPATYHGDDCLTIACQKGNLDLVKFLLDLKMKSSAAKLRLDSPLYHTASRGDLAIALSLLAAGTKVPSDLGDKNPFIAAASSGRLDMVALLLDFVSDEGVFKAAVSKARDSGFIEISRYIQEYADNYDLAALEMRSAMDEG